MQYSVKGRDELVERVFPFFEADPLLTAKKADLVVFSSVLSMSERQSSPALEGVEAIALSPGQANRRHRSRGVGILRGHTQAALWSKHRAEDMVHAPWRHGDEYERNSLSGKFRPARMA